MGEADRYQDYREAGRQRRGLLLGQANNALIMLIAILVMSFLVLLFVRVIYNFGNGQGSDVLFEQQTLRLFQLPSSFMGLLYKPWTLLTFMLAEDSVIGLISNMLWLWAFGYILQDYASNSKLIPVFIYGSVLGGLFFIASHYIFPFAIPQRGAVMLAGANPGITAIALAATAIAPNFRFFRSIGNGIPIWVLTMLYLLIALAGVVGNGASYCLATLGGALAGYLFVVQLRRGKDGSVWMINFYNWFNNLFNPNKKHTPATDKKAVFYNAGNRSPYTKTPTITQQRVDEVLDKINLHGYGSLNEEEKNILKKASEDGL
jgi:membrane associated rhomboid family serine protease